MSDEPDLTEVQKAELLVQGIEALGLDVDEECDRISALPTAFERFMAITEFQMAAVSARSAALEKRRATTPKRGR